MYLSALYVVLIYRSEITQYLTFLSLPFNQGWYLHFMQANIGITNDAKLSLEMNNNKKTSESFLKK